MLRRLLQKGFSQQPIIKQKLLLDNTYQNMMEPQKLAKSLEKFYTLPVKYNSVFEDPIIVQDKMNHRSFYLDLTRYPDEDELLVDIENFDVKEYLKYLMQTKMEDLEEKDYFPFRVIQIYVVFILHLIGREIFFAYCEYDKEIRAKKLSRFPDLKKSHFNYDSLEQELDHNISLLSRTIKRINNQIEVD